MLGRLSGEPEPVEPTKILTVCTHNRTRSVMMMALLQTGFDRSLGRGAAIVRSLGFGPEGLPAVEDAVAEMRTRHIDVSGHRSRQVNGARVVPADLVLAAEVDHVVRISELESSVFRRTFTLPEFCRAAAADPVPGGRSLADWVKTLSADRTPTTYLARDIPEVDDPTGSARRQFAAATTAIEAMCDTVVDLLSPAIRQRASSIRGSHAGGGATLLAFAVELSDVTAFAAAGKATGLIQIPQLNSFIPIPARVPQLKNLAGACLNYRDRNDGTRIIVDLRHPDLAAE